MSTDLTRQYDPPQQLSDTSNAIIKQFKPTSSSHSNAQQDESIPDTTQLLAVKAELETMLHSTQSRMKDLKKDQLILEKSVKVRDGGKSKPAVP